MPHVSVVLPGLAATTQTLADSLSDTVLYLSLNHFSF